jgi:protoporphyrinogen oxidase
MVAPENHVVVIGGGPAGLTAAYELMKQGVRAVVVEKQDIVGGIACTQQYKNFYFDMGGHRFFTKSREVTNIWHEVLGEDFLRRPRLSRIFYNNTFFDYPPRALNVIKGLGLFESLLIILSFLRSRLFPIKRLETFDQWVTHHFGRRFFKTFFEAYTEKVWGLRCTELKAEWAAQRIKGLSLKVAILSMVSNPKKTIKSLIEEFDYPRRGPGMMWNAVKTRVEQGGGLVRLNTEVLRIQRTGNRITHIIVSCNGNEEIIHGTNFISSMPLTEFIQKLDPPPSPSIIGAAHSLRYRDFITVCLVVNSPNLFPDNWIYIHDPQVKVGRIQNFKNWSPDMVPDLNKSSLGLEYFCNEGDEFWCMKDSELIALAKREIEQVGLARSVEVEDGCVFRVPKAYPIYDSDYSDHLTILKDYFENLENCQTVGRNGLHRYNNQDHSMLTGILAVRNIFQGQNNDLWEVNAEQEYHEEVHRAQKDDTLEATIHTIRHVFERLHPVAFGLALGGVSGLYLFLATMFLIVKGGNMVGPNLSLLSQFLPGYRVTVGGSFLGMLYGLGIGFMSGWSFAKLRNGAVLLYMARIDNQVRRQVLKHFHEYL